ncbi:hypothetical protein OH818_23635 [Jiella pelagia]|uniref:Uncharacterized protein n=1 Tax=Jiella pelagia TaxID=2986949 RepID=A0ABY7BXP8_9HYPH|nr:hypothetical protein [Jiella pelagia]WAP68304.1 hypothetical protein OH818_23635 [Jiella pelagia]
MSGVKRRIGHSRMQASRSSGAHWASITRPLEVFSAGTLRPGIIAA